MTAIHFSYYELSLLSFLRESHPEKADDIPFIKERAAAASEAYTEAFDAGLPITECIGIANKTLYAGLHFSRHDTISSVLWNEFSAEVSLEAVRETAIRLRPLLESIFAKYPISDEFAYIGTAWKRTWRFYVSRDTASPVRWRKDLLSDR